MPKQRELKVCKSVTRFGILIELYNDGHYLITLKNGKTLWVTCTDLEDICALTDQIFRAGIERAIGK